MKKQLVVAGMKCEGCANNVTSKLQSVDGVERAMVSLESKTAVVESSGNVSDSALRDSLAETSYSVETIEEVE